MHFLSIWHQNVASIDPELSIVKKKFFLQKKTNIKCVNSQGKAKKNQVGLSTADQVLPVPDPPNLITHTYPSWL